jgi:beta-N-acetylhexosaminidase
MTVSRENTLGQLLMLRLDESRWSASLERRLCACQPGGVVLARRSLYTPGRTAELLHKIWRVLKLPPFLGLEEEGGAVDPLGEFFPPLPAPRAADRSGLAAVKQLGGLIGAGLKLLGFNTCFAPVLDLSNPLGKPFLDTQTFSPDPQQVAQCGKAFLDGLRRHKVLPCGKHFPGVSAPVHEDGSMPLISKPMAQLWREDLAPYRQLLSRLPLVGVSNAVYKAYDFGVHRPAALSSNVLNGLLRVRLGYRGVAVAHLMELLEQGAEQSSFAETRSLMSGEAFADSVSAGCDMVVVPSGGKSAELIYKVLRKAAGSGSLSKQQVERALTRIRRVKKNLGAPTGRLSQRAFDRLFREFQDLSKEFKS